MVTFHTTTQALAMEQVCRERQLPGRLIPVPTSITAGCGLAWCAPPENRETLEEMMRAEGIAHQEMHLCPV